MNRITRIGAAAAATVVTVLPLAGVATADEPEPDPHMPNGATHYCPGGEEPNRMGAFACFGVPYEDGSYWREMYVPVSLGTNSALGCVVGGEVLAQPGACGGAWDGNIRRQ